MLCCSNALLLWYPVRQYISAAERLFPFLEVTCFCAEVLCHAFLSVDRLHDLVVGASRNTITIRNPQFLLHTIHLPLYPFILRLVPHLLREQLWIVPLGFRFITLVHIMDIFRNNYRIA
jgi:hypothetical protein